MSNENSWTKTMLDASNLVVAVVAGIWVEASNTSDPLLVTEINSIIAAIVVLALVVSLAVSKPFARRLSRFIYQGLAWSYAVLGGVAVSSAYKITVSNWQYGIPYSILVFVVVVGLFRLQHHVKQKVITKEKKEGVKARAKAVPSFVLGRVG